MSKSNQATTTEAETKPSPAAMIGELARRLANWVQTNPLQAGIVAGMILLPVAPIVVVQLTLRFGGEPVSETQGLAKALEALDRGHNGEAAAIARKLGTADPLPAEELGGKAFVLGVVAERAPNNFWNARSAASNCWPPVSWKRPVRSVFQPAGKPKDFFCWARISTKAARSRQACRCCSRR